MRCERKSQLTRKHTPALTEEKLEKIFKGGKLAGEKKNKQCR